MPQINEAQRDALHFVTAIMTSTEISFVYTDRDGVMSLRFVVPSSIEHCINGGTILRCFDVQRNAPRTFSYVGIMVGSVVKVTA